MTRSRNSTGTTRSGEGQGLLVGARAGEGQGLLVGARGVEPGIGLLERAVEQRDAVPQLSVLLVPIGSALPEPRRLALELGDLADNCQHGDAEIGRAHV